MKETEASLSTITWEETGVENLVGIRTSSIGVSKPKTYKQLRHSVQLHICTKEFLLLSRLF